MELEKRTRQFKYKQVIVIRADIGMSKGKTVAQGAHVAVNASEIAKEIAPDWWHEWMAEGHAKIACKVTSLEELVALKQKALDAVIPSASIADFGLTEIEPGTVTALAIGPAPVEMIDAITKNLKLL